MRILYIEPFDGGSHAQFTRTLTKAEFAEWTVLTLPARHWKWRMRGAAAYFAATHRAELTRGHDMLVASSYLALADLVGLVPSLASIPRVLYFHENQLAFPVQPGREDARDLHFGFSQMISGMAASLCLFNSAHNRDSFLEEARTLLARMPDAVAPGWVEELAGRSEVMPLPLELPVTENVSFQDAALSERARGPLIVWNHRWEFDKGPDAFFEAMLRLHADEVPFRLAVCGQSFRRVPPIFESARNALGVRIEHWGPLEDRADYLALLARAQICVSTAEHEFFGISMLEATHLGAQPFVPDRLAYPEIFPADYRYATPQELVMRLSTACVEWTRGDLDLRADRREIALAFDAEQVLPRYRDRFLALTNG